MSDRETFLAHTRSILWRTWSTSPEEIGSAAVATLMGLGMLVPEGGAAELERLRLLQNAQPADLSEAQVEALADAGNRALNDYYHDELCACSDWPESCASSGRYFAGTWDTAAFDIGMAAVIGRWEAMRAPAEAGESERLRTRIAELEAERHVTNEALSDAAERLRQDRDRIAELEAAQERLAETMQRGQHWRGGRLVSERTLTQREIRHLTGLPLRESTPDEYRYCGADLGRTEFPFTCYRRVAHDGPCGPQPDPEPLAGTVRTLARMAEDPHDSPLHHTYRLGHDLPEYPNA